MDCSNSFASLALACSYFLAIHFGISGTRVRDGVVDRIGLGPYLGLFSLLSLVGIVWMSRAYASAPYIDTWGQLYGLRYFSLIAVLVAFVFAVLGLISPNPTAVGADGLLTSSEPAVGILRITRHPFLMGAALWAFSHLAVNGDVASALFFGTFFVLSTLGPLSIDQRKTRQDVPGWPEYQRATSVVPFAAIVQGRNRLVLSELGWWRVALALALYGAAVVWHGSVFGASALPVAPV